MILIFSIAGAAALTVVAYSRLRARSPEAATAAARAVRELAAVVLICTRAVESVVDALQPSPRPVHAFSRREWDDDNEYDDPGMGS